MNKRLILILPVVLLSVGFLHFKPAKRNASLTISVIGADAVFQSTLPTGTGFSTGLRSLINGLPLMLPQVRSPDATFWTEIVPVSSQPSLNTLIGNLPIMLLQVRSPDATFWTEITSVYSQPVLAALLGNLPAYYIPLRSADGAFESTPFNYPSGLIQDTTPPLISNVQVEPITGLVEWDTDEFANSEVKFGSVFGNYPYVVTKSTWEVSHLILPSSGGWNFILIRSTDRSGNTAEYYYPGFTITGNVKDDQNNPIPGVVVSVSATLIAVTDANGDYSLNGVPAGEYSLIASDSQYTFTPESIAITVSGNLTGKDFVGEVNTKFIFLPLVVR